MKERGILFSAPMVLAILRGSKTQTRRIVKPKHLAWIEKSLSHFLAGNWPKRPMPYGAVGDRLWVRETWRIGAWNEWDGAFAIDYCDGPRRDWLTVPDEDDGEQFQRLWVQCCDELSAKGIKPGEDGNYHWQPGESPLRWRPSIHMPRWASRITLEITGVRVERLQEISEADAIAEGLWNHEKSELLWLPCAEEGKAHICPVLAYRDLWESINGAGSWDANPWVWVIEFRRVESAKAAA